jgi:monofunctional biosynthetic peptidoglycan transglycosylase
LVARHQALALLQKAELVAHSLQAPETDYDVIINGTASSLSGAGVPVGEHVLKPGALAYDMMYGPGAQGFMDWAKQHGAVPRDGLGMLVEQAAEAFLIWRCVRRQVRFWLSCARCWVKSMRPALRWFGLVAVALLLFQLFFVARIAAMLVIDPQSTAFERSEAWRVTTEKGSLRWRQQWTPYEKISINLKRAVIASEDDGFANHDGVDWNALEKAWQKNAKAEEQAAKAQARAAPKAPVKPNAKPVAQATAKPVKAPKVVGGSTITQQLAKNLFLSGERTLLRKGQEFVLTLLLEAILDKQRILEIYLNSVEWGEGVFGAEAAAQHYYRKPAAQLSAYEAARLAVMLPRPKYFEKLPNSSYVAGRAEVIVGRLSSAELP